MNQPRRGDRGFFHPIREIAEGKYCHVDADMVAVVAYVNKDWSLNLDVTNHVGKHFVELGVPAKENADDGVSFFELGE
jgi:hypothetical protein